MSETTKTPGDPAAVLALLALYDRQMRQDAQSDGPGARIERSDGIVRQVGGPEDWNGVLWSDLDHATADAAIAAQAQYYTSLGLEFEWTLYAHDRPRDLAERLLAAGFTPEPSETLMIAEVRGLPTFVALPEGISLHQVTDAAGVELVTAVHERVFGTDGARLRHRLLARLAQDPDAVSAVVAMAGDEPVSSARIEFSPGTDFAGLWGGGTLASWRGRGLYRALVAHRARIAAERGYRYLQVDASSESRPILERLGFAPLSVTTPFVYEATSPPSSRK